MTTSPERRIELLRQLGVDVTDEMKEREYKISLDKFAEVYGADWEEKADDLSFVLSDPMGYIKAKNLSENDKKLVAMGVLQPNGNLRPYSSFKKRQGANPLDADEANFFGMDE